MSTIPEKLQASKDGLDALLTYANGVTGEEDVNIGDAIKTLCDGYGGRLPLKCEYGELKFEEDHLSRVDEFRHSLGIPPRVVLVWSEDIADYVTSDTTVWSINLLNAVTMKRNYAGILSGAYRFEENNYPQLYTDTTWKVPSYSSACTLRGGVTYKYLLIA